MCTKASALQKEFPDAEVVEAAPEAALPVGAATSAERAPRDRLGCGCGGTAGQRNLGCLDETARERGRAFQVAVAHEEDRPAD